jgi:hypothetical protein
VSEERRAQLDIRPLAPAACARYVDELVEADADQSLRQERLDDVPDADRELGRTT